MAARHQTVLLFGPPGSGKGTQGAIIAAIPGFFHNACGDVFRRLNPLSPLGKTFMEYSSRGELLPDELTVKMWLKHIDAQATLGAYKPESDLLVLDGIPRTVRQAELIKDHVEVLKVLVLDCPDENKMIDRLRRRALKENRIDDAKESVIRHRWEVFRNETAPVLGCYPSEAIATIDAMRSPAEVLVQILQMLIPVQSRHFAQLGDQG